jgi:hypothetical protein
MREDILGIIIFIFVIYYIARPFISSGKLIIIWAKDNDLIITKKELRFFLTGPFYFTANRAIHRLEVKDKNGNKKVCWSRTGSLFGVNPKEFTVEWESIENINF